jgi:tetratricopeptide (TPR) repeat protein
MNIQTQKKDIELIPGRYRILIAVSGIISFLIVSYVFFQWLHNIGTTSDISAALSLVAGAFASYLVMSASGIIREFSIKGAGLFEFSSKLEDRIKEVKTDVVDSKREIGERISLLTQNLQQNIQSLDSKLNMTLNSKMNQQLSIEFGGEMGKMLSDYYTDKIVDVLAAKGIDIKKLSPSKEMLSEEAKSQVGALLEKKEAVERTTEKLSGQTIPFDVEKAMVEANSYFYLGRYEEALKRYEDILQHAPRNVLALVNKGIVLYRLGKYKEANDLLDKALNLDEYNPHALAYKAFILNRYYSVEAAKPYYEKLAGIEVDQNDIDALVNKGIALYSLSRYPEANTVLERAHKLDINENNIDALVNKGLALDYLGEINKALNREYLSKHKEAVSLYEKALNIDPKNVFALYSEACSYALQGKADKSFVDLALDKLEKVTKLSSEHKEKAQKDPDFEELRTNGKFKRIVYG